MEFQPIRYRMPLTWALKTLPEGARLPAYGTPGFAVRATIPEEILGSRFLFLHFEKGDKPKPVP